MKKYNNEYYVHRVLSKIQIEQNKYKKDLLSILWCFLKIREKLSINIADYEETVAHYTRPDTAMKLLKQEKENENCDIKKNSFQMSSVAYVNDPSEGKVIFDYLNELDELKNNHIILKPVPIFATFMGCFTYNHDKLNHFRLYGKEENKEATGVSIILNNYFFNEENHESICNNGKEEKEKEKEKEKEENRLPLYRCIYLDINGNLNNNPYIRVACRDELTFYREKGNIGLDYKIYQTCIDNIQSNIIEQFRQIKNYIQLLFKNADNYKEKQQLIETVSFILMPLSYMVKHSAYEEEQECRIFKFLSFDNPNNEIKTDIDNKRMYVEYLSIDNCVEKIYLSPYAEKYADMFRVLINDKDGKKVRSSDNPFR